MKNIYHQDIVQILLSRGSSGMKVCNIARRIYNKHADLFDKSVSFDKIHRSIGVYLCKVCKRGQSIFFRKEYGIYSIKPDVAIQLDLFTDLPSVEGDTENVKSGSALPHTQPDVVQLTLFD